MEGDVIVLEDGEVVLGKLGAGEMELKPTKSFRLAPWEADTGLGAAICVLGPVGDSGADGRDNPGIDGFDTFCGSGVAD